MGPFTGNKKLPKESPSMNQEASTLQAKGNPDQRSALRSNVELPGLGLTESIEVRIPDTLHANDALCPAPST